MTALRTTAKLAIPQSLRSVEVSTHLLEHDPACLDQLLPQLLLLLTAFTTIDHRVEVNPVQPQQNKADCSLSTCDQNTGGCTVKKISCPAQGKVTVALNRILECDVCPPKIKKLCAV